MMSDNSQAEARPAREARVEQLLQFILDDSEGGKSSKEKKGKDNQIVPVELGLSPDVIERLPKNVKEWKPVDAEMWLRDIFDGSSLLPQYIESFQRIGVRGIDLLAAKENEITEFGITMAVHVARVKACIDDLIRYQRYIEAEKVTDTNMRKVDQGYYDLDKAYREKCVNGTIYVPTKKMERWTDVDVFAFLSNPQHNNQLNAFIKPIANKKLNGKELLEAVSFIPETDVSAAKVIEKMDMPIVADARDFSRFRSIVLGEKSKLDVFHRRLKSENVEAMRRLIPKLDSSKLDPQIRNGRKPFDAQGSFGEVYFGKYEKRTVAIKQLKSRDSESQSEAPTTTKDGKIVPVQKEDIQSNLANHNLGLVAPNDVNRAAGVPATKSTDYKMSELLFEAYMLAQCSGAGVIQLLGFDDATSPNRLVTEFMASLSICDEMAKADANDERSIFHPNHERNRLEMANGIMNPVLYQIVRIGKDISSALARIHGLGIVHLDIAARNILLNARKQPKIADFGLAVFEKDMKVQFEHYRDRTKHIHASSVQDQERRLLIDIAMTEDLDEIAVRNYKMQNEKRPVAWSPSWVIQENPLLDSHADIYAFGCFLYEMLTHRPPHADLPTQEIIAKKARGDGNASIPVGDERFTDVIRDCWKGYDDQPSMLSIAETLQWLHQELGLEGHRFQATRAMAAGASGVVPPPPPQPTKLHREKATDPYATSLGVPAATANASPYASNLGLGGAGAAPSTPPPPVPKTKPATAAAPAYAMPSIPSAPDDVFIRLQLLDHIEFDVEFPGLFSEQGILRSVLYAWLQQEYFKRNHDFIAAYMQCVRTDSKAVHQMDTLVVCLDYLGNLAENEHGDLHDNEAWMDLSVVITRVLSTVLGIQIEDRFVSTAAAAAAAAANPTAAAAPGTAIDKELVAPVVFSAFSTLSSLCRFREFFGEDRQDIHVFARNMALAIQECLTRFDDDAGIVEMVAATVHHVLILTPVARDYFDMRGIVQLLLKQIKTHDCIAETVINLVQAVGAFPISMLLRSNHKPQVVAATGTSSNSNGNSNGTNSNSNSNAAELSSSELTSLATVEWCDVLVTLFHVIQAQVKALAGDPSKLRLSVSHAVRIDALDDGDDENDAEALQAMVERVIAACLDVLLRACEDTNVSATVDAIDKFLYVADGDMIETLVHLCRDYPRAFHIQKGAIGLLAYVLETGHEELNIERELIKQVSSKTQTRRTVFAGAAPVMVTKTVLQPVPLKMTAAARLAVVLRLDPQLLFVIEAMQTFKRDGHVALEFQSSQFDHVTGTDTQARSTRMLSGTNFSSATFGGNNTQQATMGLNFGGRSLQQPSMTFNASVGEVEINIPQLSQMYDQVTLEFDDNGEQITAASLQRYGSRILGIAARNNPTIQAHLLRSNFNELIFGAFQQFPGDIALIHAGCIALSSVCRKDAQHQRVLHQLQVSKHLITSFLFHSQMWQILDGVTCALVGLLEPPELFQLVQGGNKDTVITPAQKEKFDGFRLTEQLSKMRLFGMPIIEFFAMKVCLLQCSASHGLVTNFLKLLACMIFWKPSLLAQWENDFVTSLDAFLVLTFGKRLQLKLESALKSFVRSSGSNGSASSTNNTTNASNSNSNANSNSNNKSPASPAATKSAGATGSNNASAAAAATSTPPAPSNVQELVSTIEIISQQETAQFVEYLKQYGLKLPLSQYIRTTMRMHAMHSHVVAIALGLRVSYLRSLLPRDGQLGDDLGAALKTSKVLAAALFGEGKVSIVDNVNGWDDNIYYCLEAISRPVKNPVYLRYTLWLLLLLVSKTPDGAMMTEGEVTTDLSRSPEAIASQVAIKGGIEWAVEVMKHFPDHYTLQCLATVFLRWMEIHGRLFNRSTQRLQQLHALLLVNRDRHGTESFLTLDQEGHDPILMGSDLQKTFGLLAMHSDRLIRLVERHLQPTQPGALTADGSTSPHGSAAASFLASSPQSPLVAAGSAGGGGGGGGLFAAAGAAAANGNLWDGICRPLAINIIAIEAQEDPATRRADTYYVFRVVWDTNKTWTVAKRFRAVFDFSAELEAAFDALPPFARREFARSNYILVPRTPAFLETRRAKLQQWIEDAMHVHAVCFYNPFLAFFDVPNQLKRLAETAAGPVAPIRSIQHNACVEVPGALPVRCFAFDVVDNLLFVGGGKVLRGLGSVLSGKSLKGCVVVYALDARDGEVSLRRLHAEGFQHAVTALAWDAQAHCLLVGLSHGVTMHYHVTLPTGELTYGGEVDCQRDAVVGLQTRFLTTTQHHPPPPQPPVTQHLYVGASAGGACYVYNMLDSTMLSQTMSMAQQTLSSLAFDLSTSLMFLGNQRGQILAFDTTKSPPVLRFTIDTPLPRRSTAEEANATARRPRPVRALTFVEETRLLYCAVLNEVYVYHFAPGHAAQVLFKTLPLQKECEIVSVTVADTGRLVVVTDSEGRVVVFAPPAATAPLTSPTGTAAAAGATTASTSAAASPLLASNLNPDDLLGTSASALLDWSAIVLRSNAVIRDWLRAKGIDTSQATSRMDLLTCMQRSLQPRLSAVAGSDATRALCSAVDFPLFLWRLQPPPTGPAGKARPPATQPYAYSSFYCTGDARCLVFGTSDGLLHVVSLQQFVTPYFDVESDVLQSARQARRAATASSTTPTTSAERVGGSTKTARGKRSITALRL